MEEIRNDEFYMREALKLAEKAAEIEEAPIGCVVVLDGEIIGRGYNRREIDGNPLAHAELLAIDEARHHVKGWRLCDADLYVTLEPCPMCAGACINSRIRRVIFGADDMKAGSCGSVTNLFELPYNHKPEITRGVLKEECGEILSRFFKSLRERNKARKNSENVEI